MIKMEDNNVLGRPRLPALVVCPGSTFACGLLADLFLCQKACNQARQLTFLAITSLSFLPCNATSLAFLHRTDIESR